MSTVMEYKSPQIKKLRQYCVERLTQEQVFTVLDRLESLVFDLDNPNANPLLFGEPLIDRSSSQSEDAALESVKQEVLSLVEDLSDDADLSVLQRPEEFLSIDEVSQMYHVSTKTQLLAKTGAAVASNSVWKTQTSRYQSKGSGTVRPENREAGTLKKLAKTSQSCYFAQTTRRRNRIIEKIFKKIPRKGVKGAGQTSKDVYIVHKSGR